MARPVNHQRRSDLLDAVVDYVIAKGIDQLSWRQAAADLQVSPTTLVHHFGTKEQMVQSVLGRLRQRTFTDVHERIAAQRDVATAARAAWERSTDPARAAEMRLLFDVYIHALREPVTFAEFLDHVVADWKADLVALQGDQAEPEVAEREATLVIATIRGLLLDLLTTGERTRVQAAADLFFDDLAARASRAQRK